MRLCDGFKGHLVATFIMVLVSSIADRTTVAQDKPHEGEHATRVVIVEDKDDPQVWDTVDAFQAQPTPENTKAVFQFLQEKLADWNSHPAGLITTILETIGERKIESGRVYIVLLLNVDPSLHRATFVQATASRVLGSMGGSRALEDLVHFAKNAPPSVMPSVAVALGALGDPQAVPPLETLATHPDAKTRARALSALAKYCSATSRELVLRQVTDEDEDVRKSAAWWLASCATTDDGPRLAALLHDPAELVRLNALKGLVRLKSKAACAMCDSLLRDESEATGDLAREYLAICKRSDH
jgi:hypothetical protein